MVTPNGTKRSLGFAIMFLPALLQIFCRFGLACYTLSDAAPVEMATIAEPLAVVIGGIVLIYGTIKAKGPMWFVKK